MLLDEIGRETARCDCASKATPQRAAGRGKLVVLVDDEPAILEVVSMILEHEGGYDVRCASNGEEALELLSSIPPPDLLVIDIMMPVLDGWGLLAALRVNERLSRIPIIVASASDRHEAEALGVARFMPKPLDYDGFLAAVHELTQAAARDAAPREEQERR